MAFSLLFIWHIEGGKGTKSKMVHFQIRPDPLARWTNVSIDGTHKPRSSFRRSR